MPTENMMKALVPICLVTLLCACQSHNPYTAQSEPMPPAPSGIADHFDASAYPATPIDYSRYRSWRWQSEPVSGTRGGVSENLRDAIANSLEQRGLRPATTPNADLLVNASLRTERRIQQVRDSYGSYGSYGNYYGGGPYRGDRYGMGASIPITRSYEVEVGVLQLDFRDASGRTIWRGSTELSVRGDQADRREALYEAARKMLEDYPPR
jgi:hypothetical protein